MLALNTLNTKQTPCRPKTCITRRFQEGGPVQPISRSAHPHHSAQSIAYRIIRDQGNMGKEGVNRVKNLASAHISSPSPDSPSYNDPGAIPICEASHRRSAFFWRDFNRSEGIHFCSVVVVVFVVGMVIARCFVKVSYRSSAFSMDGWNGGGRPRLDSIRKNEWGTHGTLDSQTHKQTDCGITQCKFKTPWWRSRTHEIFSCE